MSHTPGPWKLNMRQATWDPEGGEYPDHVVDARGEDVRFAGVTITSHNPEATANSRLAAAAPELLDALKRVVTAAHQYVGIGFDMADESKELREAISDAANVIAKAEGKCA